MLVPRAEARAQRCLYAIGHAVLVEPSISNMGYITTVLSTEDLARTGQKNGAIARLRAAEATSGAEAARRSGAQ